MNDQLIREIVAEIAPELEERVWGKVWQLGRARLAVDFRLREGRSLFLSVEPQQPRLYLIERPLRELEKESLAPSHFVLALRKHLGGARLSSITKDEGDRVVRFVFAGYDALGEPRVWTLVAQLTGRAANLLLLDAAARVVETLREPRGGGQAIGELYEPPPHSSGERHNVEPLPLERGRFPTLSAALQNYFGALESTRAFAARTAALADRLRQATDKRRKLARNLEQDLDAHGDAAAHKRAGDLLLANLANAERAGARVKLIDYFTEGAPVIEIEIDEQATLQEEAARRFARYAKAKRAAQEIAGRLAALRQEIADIEAQRAELASIIERQDDAALEDFAARLEPRKRSAPLSGRRRGDAKAKAAENVPGARRYRSSDDYEILVGRGAKDNDQLTFRVARPHDLWLHAADYPGSHVIIRNHARGSDIPHRTIIEAAQLAAHFSQAKSDAKVAVNYTQRKFIQKPKGAAPGLVRLSSFRTLLVEPRVSVERS